MKDSGTQNTVPSATAAAPALDASALEAALSGPAEAMDCVVVGAGVVGLAVARELAMRGREVLILEQAKIFGSVTSSRNSEVIHAGIYYPADSLKARLCVAGKKRLYQYCQTHQVEHQRCGKLIVACDDAQRDTLVGIRQRAEVNGVTDLAWLDAAEVRRMEPHIDAVAALLSPSTGIIDSHGYMLSLLGDAEAHGAMIAYNSRVCALRAAQDGISVLVAAEDDHVLLRARSVVNSAGLGAIDLAASLDSLQQPYLPRQVLAKGSYFALAAPAPVSRLIYPVPETGGLGVHITLDLAGRVRFGPDVEWVDSIDYDVDPSRAAKFYAAIRRYWPDLPDNALQPEYAGVRPKIAWGEQISADFAISGPQRHGVPGLVNLFGIESPGLTASLAIAAEVGQML